MNKRLYLNAIDLVATLITTFAVRRNIWKSLHFSFQWQYFIGRQLDGNAHNTESSDSISVASSRLRECLLMHPLVGQSLKVNVRINHMR
ncbi:UNVERIFIED_CONTAM: hypothetical protein PVV41_26225, partial [Salmonella enterica subsp. enterica serovar Typhimurium]